MKLRFNMREFVLCLGVAIALAATQSAAASPLDLKYAGLTFGSSINGHSIADGTSFAIQIGFDTISEVPVGQGTATFTPTSISVEIGGTPYEVTSLSGYSLGFADSSNQQFPGYFFPIFGSSSVFIPGYRGTTSPGWSVADVTPTVFIGYAGSFGNSLDLSTSSGPLILGYNSNTGLDASITTPEGSTLVLLLLGMAALGLGFAMRRPTFAAR
jgi:hypothetical protein